MSCCTFLEKVDREVPKGLAVHVITDNYATRGHDNVQAWLAKHPRFHFHFTPTSSSWLNLVESWFRELTQKAIRRGIFRSVPDLVAAIYDYLEAHNADPKPFIWTASAEQNLGEGQAGSGGTRSSSKLKVRRHTRLCRDEYSRKLSPGARNDLCPYRSGLKTKGVHTGGATKGRNCRLLSPKKGSVRTRRQTTKPRFSGLSTARSKRFRR